MSQSLASIYIHIIFSTKDRYTFLRDENIREKLHGYLSGICDKLECPSLIIGGADDHVHILAQLSRISTVSDMVRELKKGSSLWMKEQGGEYQ